MENPLSCSSLLISSAGSSNPELIDGPVSYRHVPFTELPSCVTCSFISRSFPNISTKRLFFFFSFLIRPPHRFGVEVVVVRV